MKKSSFGSSFVKAVELVITFGWEQPVILILFATSSVAQAIHRELRGIAIPERRLCGELCGVAIPATKDEVWKLFRGHWCRDRSIEELFSVEQIFDESTGVLNYWGVSLYDDWRSVGASTAKKLLLESPAFIDAMDCAVDTNLSGIGNNLLSFNIELERWDEIDVPACCFNDVWRTTLLVHLVNHRELPSIPSGPKQVPLPIDAALIAEIMRRYYLESPMPVIGAILALRKIGHDRADWLVEVLAGADDLRNLRASVVLGLKSATKGSRVAGGSSDTP